MPPSKASRATAAHDDPEPKATNPKEKNGHGHGHTNGKMRRVASSTGSNLKDVTNSANLPEPAPEPASSSASAPNPTVSLALHPGCCQRSYALNTSSLLTVKASRFNGIHLTETSSTVTAANTISPHRLLMPATTVLGSSHNQGASASFRLQ